MKINGEGGHKSAKSVTHYLRGPYKKTYQNVMMKLEPEMVIQLGVVDGRVAELTLVLNLCTFLDEELDNEEMVVHGSVM